MKAIVKDKKDPLFGSIIKVIGKSNIKDHVTVEIIESTSINWKKGESELFRLIHLKEIKS
jgi:phospholipid N-methyltransferase